METIPTGARRHIRVDLSRSSVVDLRPPTVATSDIGTVLDAVASALRSLWASALERGDFDEITRLVEAAHAVHRATLALSKDSVIAVRSALRDRTIPPRGGV